MRLIDADKLKQHYAWWDNEDKQLFDEIVDLQPTVDAVEVIRCKDCIKRSTEDCAMYYECDCGEQHTWECDNDFCSYGKRMVQNDR